MAEFALGGQGKEGRGGRVGGIQEMSSRTSEIRSNTQREESPHVTATPRLYLAKGSSEHQDRSGVPSLSSAQNADSLHRLSFYALKQATHVFLLEAKWTSLREETQVNGI